MEISDDLIEAVRRLHPEDTEKRMDPDACYKAILEDIATDSFGDAHKGLTDLLEWIRNEGFTPTCFTSREIAIETLSALDTLLGYT